MSGYTPTTMEIRSHYSGGARMRKAAEFDRWLEAHDAALRAEWEAEQGEVEWEWGVAREQHPSIPAYKQRDREACERFIANPPLDIPNPRGPWLILRRRKAGPWVPVEQEGESDGD